MMDCSAAVIHGLSSCSSWVSHMRQLVGKFGILALVLELISNWFEKCKKPSDHYTNCVIVATFGTFCRCSLLF